MGFLPITAKLNPLESFSPLRLNTRNLAYMAEIAMLTRLTTGVVRVWQNSPSKLKDPKLTDNDKRQAFWERFFVEIIGTGGYMFFLYFGQDIASKIAERGIKIPQIAPTEEVLKKLGSPEAVEQVNTAIREVFGSSNKGLIYRVLSETPIMQSGKAIFKKANMTTLREQLRGKLGDQAGDALFENARGFVDDFAMKINRRAAFAILGGIAASALYGGFVTQWLTDRVVGPMVRKVLKSRQGDEPATQASQVSPATQPAQAASVVSKAMQPAGAPQPQPRVRQPATFQALSAMQKQPSMPAPESVSTGTPPTAAGATPFSAAYAGTQPAGGA